MRKINNLGLELIKKYEGFSNYAYLCPANFPTIGYGHLCEGNDFYLTRADLTLYEIKSYAQKNGNSY